MMMRGRSTKDDRPGLDQDAMRELELFVDNDSGLYHSMTQPIEKNLYLKMAKGTYDAAKGPLAWEHLLEAGARKYAREVAGHPSEWSQIFPKKERVALSVEYARFFEAAVERGEYRHLEEKIPAKYRKVRLVVSGGRRRR